MAQSNVSFSFTFVGLGGTIVSICHRLVLSFLDLSPSFLRILIELNAAVRTPSESIHRSGTFTVSCATYICHRNVFVFGAISVVDDHFA
jgi:hypothetical protein